MVKVRDSESKNFTFVQLLRIFNTSIVITSESFQQKLVQICRDYQHRKFLLAVSGGVDSMVLAYLFQALGLKFQVAHVNYHFRGEDSNDDQKLVEDFCAKNKMVFHLYDVLEKEKKEMKSLQSWAREIRYRFFKEVREKERLDYLVTAHHLNDQLETFIINLSKASGIKGLSGIPNNENAIIRPLLGFSKEEISAFAEQNNITFREDLSNQKNDYLRNRIRHQVVPQLIEVNQNFLKNFEKSIDIEKNKWYYI